MKDLKAIRGFNLPVFGRAKRYEKQRRDFIQLYDSMKRLFVTHTRMSLTQTLCKVASKLNAKPDTGRFTACRDFVNVDFLSHVQI